MIKPVTGIFAIKSVLRRKQKNIFAILSIAVGVSLIIGITVARDSLEEGLVIGFSKSLGARDASISYTMGLFNDSLTTEFARIIDTFDVDEIEGISSELILSATTFNDISGQINLGTPIYGIDPEDNSNVFGNLITKNGHVSVSELEENEIFIGKALAETLEVNTEDEINITLSFNEIFLDKTFQIRDIVLDEERGATGENIGLYCNKEYLQKNFIDWTLLGMPNYPVTRIILTFEDEQNINDTAVMEEIKELADDEAINIGLYELGGVDKFIFSTDRADATESATAIVELLSTLLTLFGALIIFAGLLLITNIQLMSIEDRERQTGIMKAVGTLNTQVLKISLLEFIITGIIGGIIGVIGGIIYGIFVVNIFGFAFGFSGSLIPIIISPQVIFIGFSAGFLLSLITGLLPAWRASKVNIIEVMRGFRRIPSAKSGMKTLYFGAFITFIGVLLLIGQEVMPWEVLDPEKYRNVSNAEALFLPPLLVIIGSVLILSYFINRDLAMNIAALVLILYPSFHIFIVFDWITEGSGGLLWITYITLSMLIGFIVLIGVNLSRVADLGEKIFGKIFPDVSLIAFRQMASQKMRSTITFAIFATVLSLNILIATWSYSARYGSDFQTGMFAANSDVIVITDQRIPTNISFETKILTNFNDEVVNAKAFPSSDIGTVYLSNDTSDYIPMNFFALNDQSLWDMNNRTIFNFLLSPEKLNKETYNYTITDGYYTLDTVENPASGVSMFDEKNIPETERAWRLLTKDVHAIDSQGKEKPIIFMTPIVQISADGLSYEITHQLGDSIWLEDINGTLIEFVIGALASNNPLIDIQSMGIVGVSYGGTGAFISETQAKKLKIFNPTPNYSYLDSNRYFLLQTEYPIRDHKNVELAQQIEKWGNSNGNATVATFKDTNGAYGIIAYNVYQIYEVIYSGMYNLFNFLQVFTSIGFLVGVLSLLVVSVRSVATRKREIGMMRAIGLKRIEVIAAIIIELITMSFIGLLIALFTGNLVAWALVDINSGGTAKFLIPWNLIAIYTILTLSAAFVAAVIPGRLAAKITPSEALRYVG